MASGKVTAALTVALLLAATSALPTTLTGGTPRKGFWKDLPVNPFCPWDAVKLGACLGLLGGAAYAGAPLGRKCCQLVDGLSAAEAAACFCTTVKETMLRVTTEWTVGVSLLASSCKTELPDGFKCV